MGNFDSSVNFVLKNEGGLSENLDGSDPGGVTNFGISFRFLSSLSHDRLAKYGYLTPITVQNIRDLTIERAKLIYRGEFWSVWFDKIQNQSLCNYIFDMVVNHGLTQACKLVQRSVWACQKTKDFIKDDGVLGSKTVQAINQCSFMLLVALQAQRDGFYRRLVALKPEMAGDLNGWLERCYRV